MRKCAFVIAAAIACAALLLAPAVDFSSAFHPTAPQPVEFFVAGVLMVGADLGRLAAATALSPALGSVIMAARTIEEMQAEQEELLAASKAIVDRADEEDRDLSEDDIAEIEANKVKVENLKRQITARQAAAPVAQGQGRRTTAEQINRSEGVNEGQTRRTTVPAQARQNPGMFGFRNFGEYAMTVRMAGGDAPDQTALTRLTNALTTYGNEGSGQDGGFIVPPDFRREIATRVFGDESLITRTDRMTTSSNTIVLPKDETSPYGTTGIQAYWEAEAAQKTQSKPVFGQNAIRLNKLIALVPVTDELLEDAPAIDSYLRNKTPQVMTAKLNTAFISGTGVGMPLGILNSPSLISVAKESSQPADSIWFKNIVNMYARMRASSLPNAVWLANQSILPQLFTMQFAPGSSTPVPVYLGPSGLAGAPYGTLMGRPILFLEAMPAVGDIGDLVFADLTQYLTVSKGNDPKTDVSIHLFFDYDVTAFRFVFRVAGQPWWNSTVTPQASGAPTLSEFVALADRA